MPKPYPREFREDVVRVARNREPGQLLKDIAVERRAARERGCRRRIRALLEIANPLRDPRPFVRRHAQVGRPCSVKLRCAPSSALHPTHQPPEIV